MIGSHTAAMSANALRGFVKTLRVERGVTQADLAAHINMPLTTYKDWERGITKDIKTPYLIRAVKFLRGSLDQVAAIPDNATAEDGAALARRWLSRADVVAEFAPQPDETPEEADRLNRLLDLLERGVPPDEAARRVRSGR